MGFLGQVDWVSWFTTPAGERGGVGIRPGLTLLFEAVGICNGEEVEAKACQVMGKLGLCFALLEEGDPVRQGSNFPPPQLQVAIDPLEEEVDLHDARRCHELVF